MLNAKENMREVIRGGNPDRYVNQFEALQFFSSPFSRMHGSYIRKGQMGVKNAWGVTINYPENVPGSFPDHSPDKIVVKDIEDWKDYVKAPSLYFSYELWEEYAAMYESADNSKSFNTLLWAPGVFEQTHYLCSMTDVLCYCITNPNEVKDLVKYLIDWELKFAEGICAHLHPEAIFHHDDWGSETNSFMSPAMFEEYFLEGYKELYAYYHNHGVELIIHHSDSYGANLMPSMIEMGIDVWQGCIQTNNVYDLVAKYGSQITFMGNIDNKLVDFEDWTIENCHNIARKVLDNAPLRGFIPCITQGGPGSVYKGTYMGLVEGINIVNEEKFGFTKSQQDEHRQPMTVFG